VLAPKEIPDPSAQKPEDWEDNPTIPDPEDKKPEDWDSHPEFIPDPEARRPDDWNDEEDGEWTAPVVPNPEFKGEWKPKMIPNPKYKGAWVHPKVPNPEYKADENLYVMDNIGGVGIEIWQVTSGTIFDNIFVGDDLDEAKTFSDKTFKARKEGEKEAKDVYD